MASKIRLPPHCGEDLDKTLLYNSHQQDFQDARRLRFCLNCKKIGSMDGTGRYICPGCKTEHYTNLTAPRVYRQFMLRAGRRSGKSLIGAHAAREEATIPNTNGWVCGPSFKILHDATMPTFLKLIPPSWVANWDQENLELRLINKAMIQFRSLDDPERGRGQGLHWLWLDEAAFTSERAWDVVRPSLSENLGIAFATTSPAGFDWSYKRFMKPALIDKLPGFWAVRYKTIDNPLFQVHEALREEVENARLSMPPKVFAAEYEGEDVNFTGSIYGDLLAGKVLVGLDAIRRFIPEWPMIHPSRPILIGLDSGADHPFGAAKIVVTEKGLVVVNEYLERHQSMVTHLGNIFAKFNVPYHTDVKWSANRNEAQLRLEFGLRGVGVIPAENKHQIGIQRVQSWLYTNQLFIVQEKCPLTVEQFQAYRYADNYGSDGQKRPNEDVFKFNDELPDSVRYAVMAYPELPKAIAELRGEREQARYDAMPEKGRYELEILRERMKANKNRDMEPEESGYPIGDFFQGEQEFSYVD